MMKETEEQKELREALENTTAYKLNELNITFRELVEMILALMTPALEIVLRALRALRDLLGFFCK